MRELSMFLHDAQEHAAAGQPAFYPPAGRMFAALELTPLDRVRAVIVGQDPYHGPGQAMGLCFSVPAGVRHPPSLQNIFKERQQDLGLPVPRSGDLSDWARSGVLLLNSVMTVAPGQAASHAGMGWERFTDRIISLISEQRKNVVFLLWGAYAQRKGQLVDTARHHVLGAPHPSPLSAHRGFFGSKPFSQTNALLRAAGVELVDWRLRADREA